MFDLILNKIKECVNQEILDRPKRADRECVIVKLQPQSYDEGVCLSRLEILCVGKTYEKALLDFDAICKGLDSLADEENEVLDIDLKSTVIKYDTVTGMTRLLGVFDAYTEVEHDDFEE